MSINRVKLRYNAMYRGGQTWPMRAMMGSRTKEGRLWVRAWNGLRTSERIWSMFSCSWPAGADENQSRKIGARVDLGRSVSQCMGDGKRQEGGCMALFTKVYKNKKKLCRKQKANPQKRHTVALWEYGVGVPDGAIYVFMQEGDTWWIRGSWAGRWCVVAISAFVSILSCKTKYNLPSRAKSVQQLVNFRFLHGLSKCC